MELYRTFNIFKKNITGTKVLLYKSSDYTKQVTLSSAIGYLYADDKLPSKAQGFLYLKPYSQNEQIVIGSTGNSYKGAVNMLLSAIYLNSTEEIWADINYLGNMQVLLNLVSYDDS